MLKHADRFESPSEERQQLWKTELRPKLDKLRHTVPENLNQDTLRHGIHVIKLGVYNMLNIAEDTNLGFEELHRKYAEDYDL